MKALCDIKRKGTQGKDPLIQAAVIPTNRYQHMGANFLQERRNANAMELIGEPEHANANEQVQ